MSKQVANCPICGSITSYKLSVPCDWRRPHIKKGYDVYWCSNCDYGQVWSRPSKEEISSFYEVENYYTQTDSALKNFEKNTLIDKIRVKISWLFDKGSDLNVEEANYYLKPHSLTLCEIGCGHGRNLLKFQSSGFSVTGVEPDPAARRVAGKNIADIHAGSAESLPEEVSSRKFDVVLMSHVLEHCLDINMAISNIKSILQDGGVFIVETPNCKSLGFNICKGEWPHSGIPRHLNFFTANSLEKILTKHEFKPVNKKYRGYCRQFINSSLKIEEQIWSAFASQDPVNYKITPNFKLRSWKLLLLSIFASKDSKYDSVRFIAKKASVLQSDGQ